MERPSLPASTFKPNQNGALPAPMMPMPLPAAPPQEEGVDVRRFLAIAKRRWLVIIGAMTISIAHSIWSAGNQVLLYQGGFQLLVEPVNSENANLANPTAEGGGSKSALDYSTQIAVLNSPELLSKVIEDLQGPHPSINYGEIINNLQIRRVGETKILEVRYTGNEPGKVQDVLEELAESYLQYSLKERQTYLRQGIQFVDEQLPVLQDQVTRLQDELQAFRQRNGFVEPDSRSSQLTGQASTLEQQRSTLEQELVRLRSSQDILQQEAGMMVALEQAPTYQALVSELRKIETEIATELTRFRPENLAIQTLERKRDNLLPLLRQEAERVLGTKLTASTIEIQSLEIQLRAIDQAQAQLQQQIQTLPVLTRQYANLQQELEVASQSLARFLETRQKLQIDAAQREIPWQVIQEPAQSVVPLNSTTGTGGIQAVAIGLVAGFGLAMLLEKLDNTYHTADDLKAKVKLPMLGILPFNQQLAEDESISVRGRRRKKKPLAVLINWSVKSVAKLSASLSFLAMLLLDEYDSSVEFMESLRVLNTNLQMMGSTRSIRSLVISSASHGDGKSTIALHWAKTAVAMGQRVLLIDANLRQPQIHTRLNLDNRLGLSNIVSKNLDLMDVVHRVSPDEEFYILPAGATPPDPASILSSHKMRQLMEKAHQSFDLVIYDTPPLSGLADANLLSRYADGLVLVVKMSKTSGATLKQTLEDLKVFQVPILGLIANGQRKYNPAIGEPALPPEEPPNNVQKQNHSIQNNMIEFPARSEMT